MMVGALTSAVAFSRIAASAIAPLCTLLASATASDAIEAASLLVICRQFGVAGADGGVRKLLALAFAREPAVREAALSAADALYLAQEPAGAAEALIELVSGAALGELVAAEEVIGQLVRSERLAPGGAIMRHLWAEAAGRGGVSASMPRRAAALEVLCMAGGAAPGALRPHVALLLDAAATGARSHAPLARAAAVALSRAGAASTDAASLLSASSSASASLGAAPWPADHATFDVLLGLLSARAGGALDGAAWFPVAEQALLALYALHPDPEAAAAALLGRMAADAGLLAGENADADADVPIAADSESQEALPSRASLGCVNAQRLARFLFALGAVALRQLVHVEACARGVRAHRLARERAAIAAAEAAAAAPPVPTKTARKSAKGAKGTSADVASDDVAAEEAEDEDPGSLAAQLGQGAVSADAELDAAREAAEAELVSARAASSAAGVVALFAPLAAAVASRPELLSSHPLLRGAALAALTRLCACDAAFCEAHLPLLFTRLKDTPAAGTRASLLVAFADLAFRFPNAMEPWTAHFYGRRDWRSSLHDPDASVRKHALTVLSHLVLNDMMKVKGHIADMARCLEDDASDIAALARLFFFELSHRTGAPIYALLPDALSALSSDVTLPEESFARIMRHLLSFVDKDKQTDALVEKLLLRMPECVAAGNAKGARDVAFCVAQLSLSERGLKRMAEAWKSYEGALADATVASHLEAAARGAKKGKASAQSASAQDSGVPSAGGAPAGVRAAAEELEGRIRAAHAERAETARAAARAAAHAGVASADGALSPQKENAEPSDADALPFVPTSLPVTAAPEGAGGAAGGAGGAKARGGKAAAGGKKAAAAPRGRAKKAVVSSSDEEEEDGSDSDGAPAAPAAKGKAAARQPLRARRGAAEA
jgi:condensin complex subunit 1